MKRKTWKEYLKYFNYFIDWYYGAYVAKPHSVVVLQQLKNSTLAKGFYKPFIYIPLVCKTQLCGVQLMPIYLS